jgi:hypothetical protein
MSRSSTAMSSPVELLLGGFVGYLREERGVSALTVVARLNISLAAARSKLAQLDARRRPVHIGMPSRPP